MVLFIDHVEAWHASTRLFAPRISFGFRKLKPEASVPKRPPAPPITRPEDYRSPNSIPTGTHERCLLLTDSILSATPVSTFSQLVLMTCRVMASQPGPPPTWSVNAFAALARSTPGLSLCATLNSLLSVHTKHDWLNR